MKKFKKILCGVAVTAAFGSLVACGENQNGNNGNNGGETPKPVSVDILQSGATLDLFEGTELSVQVKNSTEKAKWESSDSTIATVDEDDGAVYALKEGTVTITAKVGEIFDTCVINVVSSGSVPMLSLGNEAVDIFLNGKFQIQPVVSYKGEAVDGAKVTFSVLSGADKVSVSGDGLVTGNAYGTATIKAIASWNGVQSLSMESVLTVAVKPLVTSTVSAQELTLYTAEELAGVEYQKTAALEAKVFENGTEKSVSWSVAEGEEFVSLEGGNVTAVAEGEAKIKYSATVGDGDTFEGYVTVSVIMPAVELEETLYVARYDGIVIDKEANEGKGAYEWKKNSAFVFAADTVFGANSGKTVVKVVDTESGEVISDENGGVDISAYTASDSKVKSWKIYSDEYAVFANVKVADHMISTAEEFMGFMPLIKDGYTVLGADIDFTGFSYGEYNSRNSATSPLYMYCAYLSGLRIYPLGGRTGEYSSLQILAGKDAFMGTLDGLGHTVKGIAIGYGGIFQLVKNATIRNLGWEVAKMTGSGGLITQQISGGNFTVENVYVKFDLANKAEASTEACFTHGTNDTITLKNCVFDIYDTGASDASFAKWGMISANTGVITTIVLDHTYFVYNGDGTRTPTICVGATEANEAAYEEKYGKFVFATRAEYLDYLKNTANSLDGFNGYWNTSTGEPVFIG
ncbi:MAG: Ig-like domain-containing protein [Clostridia bacterium]|nr:Ig-like domain-containing protein [Clostridia bacterium]